LEADLEALRGRPGPRFLEAGLEAFLEATFDATFEALRGRPGPRFLEADLEAFLEATFEALRGRPGPRFLEAGLDAFLGGRPGPRLNTFFEPFFTCININKYKKIYIC